MVAAFQFVELGMRVADQLHHSPKVSVLLVAAEEFQFTVASD